MRPSRGAEQRPGLARLFRGQNFSKKDNKLVGDGARGQGPGAGGSCFYKKDIAALHGLAWSRQVRLLADRKKN